MKLKDLERLVIDHLRESGEIRTTLTTHSKMLDRLEKAIYAATAFAFTTLIGVIVDILVKLRG